MWFGVFKWIQRFGVLQWTGLCGVFKLTEDLVMFQWTGDGCISGHTYLLFGDGCIYLSNLSVYFKNSI